MKTKHVVPLIILALVGVALLATPILAQPKGLGPKYTKYVASLEDENTNRYGQVIFNTNPEDDGKYELEVEIEECLPLADTTVTVYLNGAPIGTIYVDTYGNGKATFYVETISTSDTITVENAITLTSGAWRIWIKAPGQK